MESWSRNVSFFSPPYLTPDQLIERMGADHFLRLFQIDAAFEREGGVVACSSAFGRRLVYSPTSSMTKDYSDARSFAEAAEKGVKRYP